MELWDKMLNFEDNIWLTEYQYSEDSYQKVQTKYESRAWSGSRVNPPTQWA